MKHESDTTNFGQVQSLAIERHTVAEFLEGETVVPIAALESRMTMAFFVASEERRECAIGPLNRVLQ